MFGIADRSRIGRTRDIMTDEQPPSHPSESPIDEGIGGAQAKREASGTPWEPIVIAVVALLIAGGVAAALLLKPGDKQPRERAAVTSPVSGLACPLLQQASDAYNSGDHVAYEAAIQQAEKIAKETLQRSGEDFGEPERIALELGLDGDARAPALLAKVDEAC